MAFIALAALDFRAMREGLSYHGITSTLSLGVMPMANLLMAGLLIRHRCRRSRGFLSGFVVSRAMAVAVFIVLTLHASEFLNNYCGYIYQEFFTPQGIFTPLQPDIQSYYFGAYYIKGYYLALAVWYGLPQLTFALVGGYLFHAFGNRRAARLNRC